MKTLLALLILIPTLAIAYQDTIELRTGLTLIKCPEGFGVDYSGCKTNPKGSSPVGFAGGCIIECVPQYDVIKRMVPNCLEGNCEDKESITTKKENPYVKKCDDELKKIGTGSSNISDTRIAQNATAYCIRALIEDKK